MESACQDFMEAILLTLCGIAHLRKFRKFAVAKEFALHFDESVFLLDPLEEIANFQQTEDKAVR